MRDVLAVAAVIAFFALGTAYVIACARILSSTGDINEPLADEDEDAAEDAEAPATVGS
jgi:hypothetical protein